MALIRINDNPPDRELRQFAVIWFVFWLVVAGLLAFLWGRPVLAAVAAVAGVVVGAIGYARVAFVRPVYLVWIHAAYPIGWVISHLVLAVIFFGLFTVVGLVMRLVGYDPLQRRIDRGAASYWLPLEPIRDKNRYFRQF